MSDGLDGAAAAFECRSLTYTYPAARACAVCDVSLAIPHGSFCAVIGPNGSGKSTLLRLLLGAEKPTSGVALVEGTPAIDADRATIARRIGVVTQAEEMVFPISVRELVSMGRYPHLGAFRAEGDADRAAVERALAYCNLGQLGDRAMNTLSGGERQRARIARALAQEPRILVLDEPTASLDIAHEMSIFELLRRLATESRVTVLIVTHNINLAARYASMLVLMDRGHIAAVGAAADVVNHVQIESVYHWPVIVRTHAGPGSDTGAPQIAPLRRKEDV
jgi:iron complex transport system ATP-binding protein